MSNTPQNLSRRKFLSGSALALSSIGIPRLPVQPEPLLAAAPAGPQAGRAPISRTLGKTGLRVPIVNMGVMNADNPAVVQQSYEIGVRLFDTALGYQGGRNEEMIGSVIKNLGVRDKVIIQTKIPVPRTGMGLFSASAAQATSRILSDFERCLKRLQTNYVDVLLMHQPSVSQINEPGVMKALSEAKRQGRAHFIGFSAHGGQAEILNDAARSQFYDVALVAFNFTNAGDTAILEAIRNASAKGIGIIAMKTQASGRRFPGSRAVNQTAALKWVLNHTEVTTAIPGYTNFEHMKEDFSVAYSLDYTAEEKEFLADKNIRAEAQYCKQCGKCLKTCPNGVDIPSLMRCHMYAASYGNFYQARVTLDEIEENRHLRRCGSCSRCSARCSESLDLARNIEDLRTTYL
jgi:predicted aldo/keto reductase-like oxidoreductase